MTTLLITTPSGLQGRVRGLNVEELETLTDVKLLRDGDAFDQVLEACWLETVKTGPAYNARFTWGDVLQGDRFYILLAIRRATHWDKESGSEQSFDFTPQCAHCREKYEWSVWLEDLPVKTYPEESLKKFRAEEEFTAVVADRRVTFRLVTGDTERKLSRLLRTEKKPLIPSLAFRLTTVEGLERHQVQQWLRKMPVGELTDLRQKLEAVDGGLETTIDTVCKHCGGRNEIELPFGTPDFWVPKKRGAVKHKLKPLPEPVAQGAPEAESSTS